MKKIEVLKNGETKVQDVKMTEKQISAYVDKVFNCLYEMAEKWDVSSRRVALLCSQERIDGAFKKGKTWLIPENAVKPVDTRMKANKSK